ncbi:MAG TPA: CPXCG motif-containing cysteine-rich protein [Terriglobales bacterium]|nr:CPXCG motif-containing cysteine-rich protein [Terriglobales bacterium]
MTSGFQCAGCGEWNETAVDEAAGLNQLYVEDCQVCCKPNVLHVTYDADMKEYTIAAELE